MSLSFPFIWVPGSSFILASCLIGKEAISSILLDQCLLASDIAIHAWKIYVYFYTQYISRLQMIVVACTYV